MTVYCSWHSEQKPPVAVLDNEDNIYLNKLKWYIHNWPEKPLCIYTFTSEDGLLYTEENVLALEIAF